MRSQFNFRKLTLLACAALMLASFTLSSARAHKAPAVEYSFKVHNIGRNVILALMVSEDGKGYGKFDIGDGIEPGETVTLVWDKSTDNSKCAWFIKAVFDDGEQSPAKKFDFCEDDLVLEFK
ncbi:MAG: hypothetical protein JO360_03040 [Acidobacteria bacterium]|nr:hypothetical protein [Acidobacteriota bacterium]